MIDIHENSRGARRDGRRNLNFIFTLGDAIISLYYSVFPLLRRVVYKLSSEVWCGEVTNPKWPVREIDRQCPTALQCYYMCVYVEMGVVLIYSNTAICRAK